MSFKQAIPNLNEYIEMCVYDLCGTSNQTLICDHMTTYADDCVNKLGGVPMPKWRTADLCRKYYFKDFL